MYPRRNKSHRLQEILEDLAEERLEEEEEEEEDDDEEDDEDEDDEDDDEERTFSQEDVDRIAKRSKAKARRQARKDLFEVLGVSNEEELASIVEKAKKPPTKPKAKDDDSEEDAKVDTEAIQREADRKVKEIELNQRIAEVISDEYEVPFKQARKIRKLVEVESDADEDEILEALEELEKDMPTLFGQRDDEDDDDDEDERPRRKGSSRQGRQRRQTNPGSSPRRPRGKGKNPQATARTLLHERHPQTKKST